jgi:acyl carrier protein
MDSIEDKIREVVVGVLAGRVTAGQVSPDADLVEEYGLDSLQMISFLLGIEDAFDVELDYENLELDHLRSVAQFAAYVRALAPAA